MRCKPRFVWVTKPHEHPLISDRLRDPVAGLTELLVATGGKPGRAIRPTATGWENCVPTKPFAPDRQRQRDAPRSRALGSSAASRERRP
jgi:hypothetical protein